MNAMKKPTKARPIGVQCICCGSVEAPATDLFRCRACGGLDVRVFVLERPPMTSESDAALMRQTLREMPWEEAYLEMIDGLTVEQALRILRCMSSTPRLYRALKAFVENSLDEELTAPAGVEAQAE